MINLKHSANGKFGSGHEDQGFDLEKSKSRFEELVSRFLEKRLNLPGGTVQWRWYSMFDLDELNQYNNDPALDPKQTTVDGIDQWDVTVAINETWKGGAFWVRK